MFRRVFPWLAAALTMLHHSSRLVAQARVHDGGHWEPNHRGVQSFRSRNRRKYARGVFCKVDRSQVLPPGRW